MPFLPARSRDWRMAYSIASRKPCAAPIFSTDAPRTNTRASFETPAARAPQDEVVALCHQRPTSPCGALRRASRRTHIAVAVSGKGLGEFGRIARFFAPLAGPGGLGLVDDAALLECAPGQRLVVTVDAMVEGVH